MTALSHDPPEILIQNFMVSELIRAQLILQITMNEKTWVFGPLFLPQPLNPSYPL